MNITKLTYPLLTLLALGSYGCTFEEGNSWGELHPTLSASHELGSREDTSTGLYRIGNNYELELTTLTLTTGELRVNVSPNRTASTAFDPANPPAGYSLCHNGHCHADDGRLVDYDDIALELLESSGAALPGVSQIIDQTATLSQSDTTTIALDSSLCQDDCFLPQGELASAYVSMTQAHVEFTVFDTSEQQRLPEEGLTISHTFDLAGARLEQPLEGVIGEDLEHYKVNLGANILFPASGFDGVDWQAIDQQTTTLENELKLMERLEISIETNFQPK